MRNKKIRQLVWPQVNMIILEGTFYIPNAQPRVVALLLLLKKHRKKTSGGKSTLRYHMSVEVA